MKNRPGFSLAEMLVSLVIASAVSASIIQLMVVQSRFMTAQEGRSNARSVARGATGLMMSELRMVQTTSGVVSAAADSIIVRVPFRMGMICGNSGGNTIAMFQPVDSVTLATGLSSGNLAGYGWRDGSGNLTYVESTGAGPTTGSVGSVCSGASITVPTNWVQTRITPAIATAFPGMPVFLHSRVTYAFGPSASVTGRDGLYRKVGSGAREELVAPFDTVAKFRYFWVDSTSAKDSPPASLSDIAGVELNLAGVNERAPAGSDADLAPLRTAVFFKN